MKLVIGMGGKPSGEEGDVSALKEQAYSMIEDLIDQAFQQGMEGKMKDEEPESEPSEEMDFEAKRKALKGV